MSKGVTSKEDSSLQLYKRLLSYIRPTLFAFLLSVLGYAIYSASNVLFLDLLEKIFEMIESDTAISSAARLSIPVTLMVIVVIRGVGSYLGMYFMAYLANQVVHKLRCEIIDRFLVLPVKFYDKRSSGHLISTVTFNVSQVNIAVSDALTVILREGLTVIGLFGYLLYLNWKLTLIFVAVIPAISSVVLYASKKFRKHSNRIQHSMGDVTHILSETIKGFKVVRTFNGEKQVKDKFKQSSELNLKQNLKMASVTAISTPVIQFVVALALALLIWLAMSPSALSAMSPGTFVVFISAAGALLKPIRQLSKINAPIQKGLAAAKTVFDLLDEAEEDDTGEYEVKRVKGKVEFKQVSFRYETDQHQQETDPIVSPDSTLTNAVLKDVSFVCEAGKSIAFVGKSGSGKSTLVNLIARFYETNQGQILIDDVPNQDFILHNLRQQISLVSQQVVLFNGSIRDNIAYGSLADSSDKAIFNALKSANAMEFIDKLPQGIDTKVGDDATLLSGGQRQRLAIARALLKDAPILILDEATSALDSVSERYIQAALETLMAGRTTFVIAHRLSTIENADKIVVMSEGAIVESGTHQELLALGDYYSRLHQMQFADT